MDQKLNVTITASKGALISSLNGIMPAATMDEIIWQYPATLVFHLVAAAARKSGGSTRRPESRESIMDALEKLATQEKAEEKPLE